MRHCTCTHIGNKNLENKTNKTNCDVFNLGTGNGYSVLEVIKTFEKVSGILLNYTLSNRREGDVIAIYANNDKAKTNYIGIQNLI